MVKGIFENYGITEEQQEWFFEFGRTSLDYADFTYLVNHAEEIAHNKTIMFLLETYYDYHPSNIKDCCKENGAKYRSIIGDLLYQAIFYNQAY